MLRQGKIDQIVKFRKNLEKVIEMRNEEMELFELLSYLASKNQILIMKKICNIEIHDCKSWQLNQSNTIKNYEL